jgi:hypothetical protein
MAGYAQELVGVDLDHVTTSRHDPQAAEYGGTVTLRAGGGHDDAPIMN